MRWAIVLCFSISCASPTSDVDLQAEAIRVCAAGETIEGIDVSTYQGMIDWDEARASGIDFAVVRVGDGLGFDARYDRNWAEARRVGMLRSTYQFFRPGRDPIAQADLLLMHMGTLEPDDLPPVIDVEASDGQTPAVVRAAVVAWIDHVRAATGRTPIIYTGKYFWQDSVGEALPDVPLWIAAWGPTCPDTPNGWDNWAFWQYSATGTVPGITGDVDLDVFNGSLAELRAWANMNAGPIYGASYVAQSWPLASEGALDIPLGSDVPMWIELRNSGTADWDSTTRLALTNPRDRTSPLEGSDWLAPNRPAGVTGTIPPGETFRFEFTMHGAALGDYDETFGLVQEGVTWFSDPGQGGPSDGYIEGLFRVVPGAQVPDAGVPDASVMASDGGTRTMVGGGCCAVADRRSDWLALMVMAIGALVVVRRRR